MLDLWRRGTSLYWAPAGTSDTFENSWDDGRVRSLTPAFDTAATVAFSVQLSAAHSQFYYRVYGAIAERISQT